MRKRMAIVSSYFSGETYGLLGPQLAATIIQDHTDTDCVVIAVTNEDDLSHLRSALAVYFDGQEPLVGFSTLSGRENLFAFAKSLTEDGALTILGGPQAGADYRGETGWPEATHRFHGLSEHFSFALSGPAEQVVDYLKGDPPETPPEGAPGVLYRKESSGRIVHNPPKAWEWPYFNTVRWDNLFVLRGARLERRPVQTAQVLQQIGCPHAVRSEPLVIDAPSAIAKPKKSKIPIQGAGCSFCDVATDKGFCGTLEDEVVLSQILGLPEDSQGRKIPFELINENPLPRLPRLLERIEKASIRISQINLIMRADWFLKGERHLIDSLRRVETMKARILMASMGFEAFDDTLLKNFNKGVTVQTNIEAVRLMRRLKEAFPRSWLYANREGAIHGYIHPTPWDTPATFANTQKVCAIYGLASDILPFHSTPLIIHHASALGDWIRTVEESEGIRYKRYGSIVGWWEEPQGGAND